MAKGIALSIGLNAVDPAHYDGWTGELTACEADAQAMAAIAVSQGMASTTLLTKQATRAAVREAVGAAAKDLRSGDFYLLTYSGHGGVLPDLNGDEEDAQDETWCLYDGELVDDELYQLLSRFEQGVRVSVLVDACHSGTMLKADFYQRLANEGVGGGLGSTHRGYKAMPQSVAAKTYLANEAFYEKLLADKALGDAVEHVKASVVLLSACQDNQLSLDGTFNGLFTSLLLRTWNGGKFKGSYRAFHKKLSSASPPSQSPNLFTVGLAIPALLHQRPFTVQA